MASYIPHTQDDVRQMLSAIGVDHLEDLFKDILPRHRPRSFRLPEGLSEWEVTDRLKTLADKNRSSLTLFVGGGYYDHYIPAVVDALTRRGEFLTAYTPYQAECSQGTLQALYEYQGMICALTGMEAANASLYDGGTALCEAVMMAARLTGRKKVIVDEGVNPIYRQMLRTYTRNLHFSLCEVPSRAGRIDRKRVAECLDASTAAVIGQNPNFFGVVENQADLAAMAHRHGALAVQSVYPIALGLMKPPGEMDMDIVTGEGQSLGLPLNFGGPYLGFMATRKKYMRKMPGRIVGATVDRLGRRCFVNTLQAREQHIRRQKATSNICTNVAWCAVRAAVFLSVLGRQGLWEMARLNADKAAYLRKRLAVIDGVRILEDVAVFNEFTVRFPRKASEVVERMAEKGFAAGFPLEKYYPDLDKSMVVAVTEKRSRSEMDRYAQALEEVLS